MKSDVFSGAVAIRSWVQGRRIWLELSDSRIVGFPAKKYRLLAHASPRALAKVKLRLKGRALRWESRDEDILVEDIVRGRFPRLRIRVA